MVHDRMHNERRRTRPRSAGGRRPSRSIPTPTSSSSETCTVTVVAAQVTDAGHRRSARQHGGRTIVVSFTRRRRRLRGGVHADLLDPGERPNAAITGTVTTEGVVVGDFEGSSGPAGLLPAGRDRGRRCRDVGRHLRLHRQRANTVSAGEVVRVTGFARERFNQTTINGSNSNTAPCRRRTSWTAEAAPSPRPMSSMPFADRGLPRALRGHARPLPAGARHLRVLQLRALRRARARPAARRRDAAVHRTAIDEPGAPAQARALANSLRRITLDDGLGIQNPDILRHPNGGPFSLANRFRGGDTVAEHGRRARLRLQPLPHPADRARPTTRGQPAAGRARAGRRRLPRRRHEHAQLLPDARLRPAGDPLDNACGGGQNLECRGADADQPLEFTRQRDKLLAALAGLDADIIGLNELENTPGVDPLGDPTDGIVAGLNAMLGAGTYAYIDTGVDRHRRDPGRPHLQAGRGDPGRRLPDPRLERRSPLHRHPEPTGARADLRGVATGAASRSRSTT